MPERITTGNPHGAAVLGAVDPVRTTIVAEPSGDVMTSGKAFVSFVISGPNLRDAWDRWHGKDGRKLDPIPEPELVLKIYDRLHAAIRQIQNDGRQSVTINCWEVCHGR